MNYMKAMKLEQDGCLYPCNRILVHYNMDWTEADLVRYQAKELLAWLGGGN